MKVLAEAAREARNRLDEARVMGEDAFIISSRGRSANHCPKQTAARFVRAWERETSRAERAESLAARRPTIEFQQVCADARATDSFVCSFGGDTTAHTGRMRRGAGLGNDQSATAAENSTVRLT